MDRIDNFRALTRELTRAMGVFGSDLAESDMTLTEARVFYEISQKAWSGRALAQHLGLDEGYVSRIATKLENLGWVVRAVSDQDRRRRVLTTTQAGQDQAIRMIGWMRGRAGDILGEVAPMNETLTDDALGRLRHHLAPETALLEPVTYRDMGPGESGWITQRFSEYATLNQNYDSSFEALVGRIMSDYLIEYQPERDRVWIAERAGLRLGSIMCVHSDDPDVAKLRLFFLDPLAQGQGIGAEMVQRCVEFAREVGYSKMVLWTQGQLYAAIKLYERAGFVCVGRTTETEFGQTVENQSWELVL